jgi:hypothetical protein
LRKYGFNTNPTNNFEANSASNVFGQRIRQRKRPTPWTAGYEEEDQFGATPETTQSTLQTTKKSKADQYKKKFRPFFDQLYDQLTGNDQQQQQEHDQEHEQEEGEGEEVDEDGVPVRGWARRSTTTPNPFTINAEIYEVHPDSRERITTTKSTTTTTPALPPTTTLPEVANDYDENEPRVDDQPEDEVVYVDTNPSSPLEYVEFKLKSVDSTEQPLAQFDLAFKPSQVEQNSLVHNEAKLEFGESQREEEKWNAVAVPSEKPQVEDHEMVASLFSTADLIQSQVPEQPANNVGNFIHFQPQFVGEEHQTPNSRLEDYEKHIDPQLQHWTEEHFDKALGHLPVLNEHTQQHMHVAEGDFIPFQPRDPEGPRLAYTEIHRVPVNTEEQEVNDIHNIVDQAYQLQDVQSPEGLAPLAVVTTTVNSVQVDDEVTDKSDEATTQVIFVTRPTTVVHEVTEHSEEVTAAEAVNDEDEVEPQPEVTVVKEEEDHETDLPTSTQQTEYFEVTTFRPKVTGGFFENFNLGNLLGFILPSTTTVPPTTTLPVETTEEVEETTASHQEGDLVVEEKQVVDEPVILDVAVEEHEVTLPVEVDQDIISATEPTLEIETTQEVVRQEEELKVEPAEVEEVAPVKEVASVEIDEVVPTEAEEVVPTEVEEVVPIEVEEVAPTEIDEVAPTEVTTEENVPIGFQPLRFGRPKAIAQPAEDQNDLVQPIEAEAAKTSNISKSVYGAIKREEYLKNWVASRKYHKFTEAGNKHGVIIGNSPTDEPVSTEDDVSEESTGVLQFVPTVLPNINRDEGSEWETSGVSIKAKRRKVNPLLDKLSSSRKSLKDSLFAKSISAAATSTTSTTTTTAASSSESSAPLYPRGSDTKVFKQWQGDSLSQAEFERKVLGVSTATEVSVKSVICVRGRCYNADDVPSFIGN